jgi:hypothetical protein
MGSAVKILPVVKLGSQWEAQIISIESPGFFKTNIIASELKPFLATSKVWFDVGIKNVTIRGLSDSVKNIEKGRAGAVVSPDGYIDIVVCGVDDVDLKVGNKVMVHFRV